MFFRCFFVLCVIVVFNAAIIDYAEAEPKVEVEDRANPAVKVVTKIIASLFKGAAASCLTEAASKCKDHWKHPKAALNCAKDFLKQNKGRCAVGK